MIHWISGNRLPWKRFWVAWDESISAGMDGRGFLADPEDDFGRHVNFRLRGLDELLSRHILVLSGQPGIGKTSEVTWLEETQENWLLPNEKLIYLNGRELASPDDFLNETVKSELWKSTLASGGSIRLMIDALDEALQSMANLVPVLAGKLRGQPLERIRLILACRVAEWKSADGSALANLWSLKDEKIVYELCPLRWKDAMAAAVACGIDPEAFGEALHKSMAHALAARPITLGLLIRQMKSKGKLSDSHNELYEEACTQLCKEVDPDRLECSNKKSLPRPPFQQILRVACRIAMLMLLGQRSVLLTRSEETPAAHELLLEEVCGGEEAVGEETFFVSEHLVRAVLDTPLFTSRGENRYGFDHLTFAEHLAAKYLSSLSVQQVRRLICWDFQGRKGVAPQLRELAARLAGMSAVWFDHLVEHEPEVLLRADITACHPEQKARAIKSLLERASKEEAFDNHGTGDFYSTFDHPELAETLRPYIENTSANMVVRRMALDIAKECCLRQLEPLLWERLRNGDELLEYVCKALKEISRDESLLRSALDGEIPDNEYNEVKVLALRKLVPDFMKVSEVLPYLTPQPTDNYLGSYHTLLTQDLPKLVTVDEVPAILAYPYQVRNTFERKNTLNEIIGWTLALGLKNLAIPTVEEALAKYWRKAARAHEQLFAGFYPDEEKPLALLEVEAVRRQLAKAVLLLTEAEADDVMPFSHELLRGEDARWMMQELLAVAESAKVVWARATAILLWRGPSEDDRELLLRCYAECEELRPLLPQVNRFDVFETLKRVRRASALRLDRRKQLQKSRRKKLTRSERVERVFQSIALKNDTSWVGFCNCAWDFDSPNEKREHQGRSDITESPAWLDLSPDQQVIMTEYARRFLMFHQDNRKAGDCETSYSHAAAHGVWLLRQRVKDEEDIRDLVVASWPLAVLDKDSSKQQEMTALIYEIAPAETLCWFENQLKEDNQREKGFMLCLRQFENCWDAGISTKVVDFIKREVVKPDALTRCFFYLSKFDRPIAYNLASEFLAASKAQVCLNEIDQTSVIIAMFFFPKEWWTDAWPIFERLSNSELRRCVGRHLKAVSVKESPFLGKLTEVQLSQLYLRLNQALLSESQRPKNRFLHMRDEIAGLRVLAMDELVSRGTEEACLELRHLADQVPNNKRIMMLYLHRNAQDQMIRQTWGVMRNRTAKELLAMTRDPRVTTVDSAEDLFQVVVDSLERLQQVLSIAESTERYGLWNEDKAKPEKALSDVVANWLRKDIGPKSGVILDREVEATILKKLDIKVQAFSLKDRKGDTITVVIEVKGCWNPDLKVSLGEKQLVGYLEDNHWSHGIYLVGYFAEVGGVRWGSKTKSAITYASSCEEAQTWQDTQTLKHLTVKAIVLNCGGENHYFPSKPPIRKKKKKLTVS